MCTSWIVLRMNMALFIYLIFITSGYWVIAAQEPRANCSEEKCNVLNNMFEALHLVA